MNTYTLPKALLMALILIVGVVFYSSSYLNKHYSDVYNPSVVTYFFVLYSIVIYFNIHLWSDLKSSDVRYHIKSLGLIIAFVFTFLFPMTFLHSAFVDPYLLDVSNSMNTYLIAGFIACYAIYSVSKIVQHAFR